MYTGYIYKVTNNTNGKSYVGFTTRTIEWRWKKHRENTKKQYPLKRDICEFGKEQFTVEQVDVIENDSKDNLIKELLELEKHYIQKFDTYKNGYNKTTGGYGNNGFVVNNETKEKHRQRMLGKKLSDETKKKLSETHKGKYVRSTVEKAAIHNSIPVIAFDEKGIVIERFKSVKSAGDWLGVWPCEISQCCKGKRKTVKGLIWKYDDCNRQN